MTRCAKCGRAELEHRQADRRAFFICRSCGQFTYERRTTTGPFETIVDQIAEGVAERGYHEVLTVILINTAFRASDHKRSLALVNGWAATHLLRVEQRADMTCFERDVAALNSLMRNG